MKKTLGRRLFTLMLCLCLFMSTISLEKLAAVAETASMVAILTDLVDSSEGENGTEPKDPGPPTEEPAPNEKVPDVRPTRAPGPETVFGNVNGDGSATVAVTAIPHVAIKSFSDQALTASSAHDFSLIGKDGSWQHCQDDISVDALGWEDSTTTVYSRYHNRENIAVCELALPARRT